MTGRGGRGRGRRRLTEGFTPLPDPAISDTDEVKGFIRYINKEMGRIVAATDAACRARTAPEETYVELGQMKGHLRSAAQAASTAIRFAEQARNTPETDDPETDP